MIPYGTKIKIKDNEPLNGIVGTIVGKSTQDQPVIGATYIIRPQDFTQVYSEDYPYHYITCFECQFDIIK
jgi:hypothetical protein